MKSIWDRLVMNKILLPNVTPFVWWPILIPMCVRMPILLYVYCERSKARVNSVVERGQEIMRQKKAAQLGPC